MENRNAEVIIIGAGVVGCSIAYHLGKLGCQNVIVLEKNCIGSGSTEKCAGGIRQQFSSEINVRFSIESVKFLERFKEETGHLADFRQYGYLILATTEEELEYFRQNVDLQRKLGVEVYLLSPQEAKEIVPELNVEDVLGGTYCPTDGYADPYSVVHGFASAAKRFGARIYEDTEVVGIELKGDEVRGVLTVSGRFYTPVVVNAAGPYASLVGKMAGLDLPVRPSRRHLFVTEPLFGQFNKPDQFNRLRKLNYPMTIDFQDGFWFRREGMCLIFGMRNPNEPEGFDTSVDWGFLPIIGKVAIHRLPLLGDVGVMRGQAGLHPDTPDNNGILGKVPRVDGLFLACGFGGHGFQHSPAIGRIMAELILNGGVSSIEVSSLSLDRFEKQVLSQETCLI